MNHFGKIAQQLSAHGLDAMLVTSAPGEFYAAGFHGEGMAVVTPAQTWYYTDSRYIEAAGQLVKDAQVGMIRTGQTYRQLAQDIVSAQGIRRLGFEDNYMSVAEYSQWKEEVRAELVPASEILDLLRMVKDEEELDILTTSSLINDKVLAEIFENINGDISELELSRMRYELFAKYGADAYGTNVIFSYGAHCAEAHHVSDDTRLTPGDCIMFDLGAPYGHYCSDQTRTVFYKEVSPEMEKIYHIVLEAHLQASAAIRPGVACSEIDRIARDIITNEGYGSYFTHRTGHGIGLDSHEFPDISLSCSEPLQKGMVFSVEPGIYLPQKGGVRIENLFAVTDDGAVSLNHLPRELKVIG